MDNFCLIPSFLHSSCVTCAANCGPRSEIITAGNPVRFHTLSSSNWLVSIAVIFLFQGERIIALLFRSTTVRMLSYPLDVGRSVIKSIVMVSQSPCGISFGLIGTFTGGQILVVWQVAHPLMYALTNSVIPGHQYSHVMSSIVFHWPGCPIVLSWNICVTFRFKFSLFGT